MKKIKVNKKTANFLEYVKAILITLIMMFGMVASTSFFSLTPIGWCLEITMIIMFVILSDEVEEKPDINNAEHVSVYAPNVSEQHAVQQSHEKNEDEVDDSLFIIICILMLLVCLFACDWIENYYFY